MPTMYAKVSFAIEFIDSGNNPKNAVESGFSSVMPASVISVQRGEASFRLESDSLITGSAILKHEGKSDDGIVYILECDAVYKCSIKPDYIDGFLNNNTPAELGTISLNDPKSGDRIGLTPGKPIRGVTLTEETGPWGRMGAMISREHLNIDLTASKTKPKT